MQLINSVTDMPHDINKKNIPLQNISNDKWKNWRGKKNDYALFWSISNQDDIFKDT